MARGLRAWHPFTDFTNYKHNKWEMVCNYRKTLGVHQCKCLKALDELIARDVIALYMVAPFFNKSKQYTPEKHATILAALAHTRVCKYAVYVFLDWGCHKWETCLRNLKDSMTPTHRLKGKQPNNTQEFDDFEIIEDIVEFFDELKELDQPQSTRIMRVETDVGLRDGEEGGSLDAFTYHKGIGVKELDNIASIIIMLLKHKGRLKEDEIEQKNHVLCLANLLVGAGYFKKVNSMFYIVGHTKNCADMMKRDYQNQNLYTFEQLVCKALGTTYKQITIHSVSDGNFKHYKWLEDLFYKELKTVDSDAPTTMKIRQDHLGMADIPMFFAKYNKLTKELQRKDLNLFLYHFETGFDALCAVNGHLVLTILDGCKQTNAYISQEVFPDHDEGNSVAMDHVWAMEAESQEQKRLEQDGHTFPAKECKRSIKAEEAIIEKERLESLYYSTDTRFYSTDERYPVMGNRYTKHINEVQKEDLNPFLYHFETGYDCLCNRNGHLVLTILDRCKLTNTARTRLNSRKRRFEEEGASFIQKKAALNHVHYKLFLDHQKGNIYATNHIWGQGIILSYLLLYGYPPLNGKPDIHCYYTISIGPRKANSQEQNKLEQNKHLFPAMEWCKLIQSVRTHMKGCIHCHPGSRPCLRMIQLSDWWIMITWDVMVKECLKNLIYKSPTEEYATNTEQADEVKVPSQDTERKPSKEQWDSFMNKSKKLWKTKKQKLKQLRRKTKRRKETKTKESFSTGSIFTISAVCL
eukprot:jgi/Psemu1/23535/gm1.23535_g